MNRARFKTIARQYARLRIAVVGDFCLDRYLEIDPRRKETSIETGLPVHNVVNIRSQPGGAGTILNNLVALGIGEVFPIGFAGEDGEGFELRRALGSGGTRSSSPKPSPVKMDYFLSGPERRTFTYTKPLIVTANKPPRELNRLDLKNWTPTPASLQKELCKNVKSCSERVDALILLDQVDLSETGVVTAKLLQTVAALGKSRPNLLILADSRQRLNTFPPMIFKMNAAELSSFPSSRRQKTHFFCRPNQSLLTSAATKEIRKLASELALENCKPVFVTLSENGILGALPTGEIEHAPALPIRGAIDIVGAGDAVTANLVAALAAGSDFREAMMIANAAASHVIHQLGTTGTASVRDIQKLL